MLISLTHPSINCLLQQKLGNAIAYYGFSGSNSATIPLYRSITPDYVLYRSPIVFHLANAQSDLSNKILQQILNYFFNTQESTSPVLKFTVTETSSGWLEFVLDNFGLNIWLQQLPQLIITHFPVQKLKKLQNHLDKPYFLLQYAHTRCCALLRLGEQESIISTEWVTTRVIPTEGQFLRIHPSERRLIAQILAVVDEWEKANTKQLLKLAIDLSYSVLNFDKDCRIFGEVKQENFPLSQARLGLIAITSLLLQYLLERLDILPLTEL